VPVYADQPAGQTGKTLRDEPPTARSMHEKARLCGISFGHATDVGRIGRYHRSLRGRLRNWFAAPIRAVDRSLYAASFP